MIKGSKKPTFNHIFWKKNTMSNIVKKLKVSAKNIWQNIHNMYNKSAILWKLYMEKFNLKMAVTLSKLFSFSGKIVKNYAYLLNLS